MDAINCRRIAVICKESTKFALENDVQSRNKKQRFGDGE
jgi:hypothetical protein